jgi:DNA-binding NtrC family response regulator
MWERVEIEMLTYLPRIQGSWAESRPELGNISTMLKKSAPRVLVVDDEALIRWSLSEMLGERGYVVTEAGDARMALAAIEQATEPFDVVLLDYRLPDSADLRLLETVRRLAPTSQVILITAHNSPELALGAAALGAYRVISKPFEVENLAALVNQARIAGAAG